MKSILACKLDKRKEPYMRKHQMVLANDAYGNKFLVCEKCGACPVEMGKLRKTGEVKS